MEIVGQGAGQRLDQVIAPVLPELDVEDVDLQHVAGLGALDRDRAGQDMARHHALVLGMDLGKLGRDVKLAAVRHHVGAAADGVDRDFIAAGDGQDRLQFGFEEAPVAGLGAGMQVMMGHGADFLGALHPFLTAITFCEDRWIRGSSPRMTVLDQIQRGFPCSSCSPRRSASCCCRPIS